MTPILQRMYQDEGGSELCDTLMKYLYKGMGQGSPTSNSTPKNLTPQATGFSQVGGRHFGGGEGGGQAMSVFLSWHEKVGWPFVIDVASLLKLIMCSWLRW